MEMIEIAVEKLREADWNPNRMDAAQLARLATSIRRYGVVQNLVVRPRDGGCYEVLSGNHRLRVLRELGIAKAPCAVVTLDDARAKLLAQALNHIQGEDDLGMRSELVRQVLAALPPEEVRSLLPDSAANLDSLASLGQETIAEHLEKWQRARPARLKHLLFHLTPPQLEMVQQALKKAGPFTRKVQADSPNVRSAALYLVCRAFLDGGKQP